MNQSTSTVGIHPSEIHWLVQQLEALRSDAQARLAFEQSRLGDLAFWLTLSGEN
jgi:hypothetical protein